MSETQAFFDGIHHGIICGCSLCDCNKHCAVMPAVISCRKEMRIMMAYMYCELEHANKILNMLQCSFLETKSENVQKCVLAFGKMCAQAFNTKLKCILQYEGKSTPKKEIELLRNTFYDLLKNADVYEWYEQTFLIKA